MKSYIFYFKFIFISIFAGLIFLAPVKAQDLLSKRTHTVLLGETGVKINVYEKTGGKITFVAPHHNEQIAIKTARAAVEKNGGRLVEIESFDQNGRPARNLSFKFQGKTLSVDPNRIFTENGRNCGGFYSGSERAVKNFAEEFLKIVLAEDGRNLRDGERFIVAVHNNSNVDEKHENQRASDLTATAFVKNVKFARTAHNSFQEQADGVYLSNLEDDADNFIFLSTPAFIGFFAEKHFNVVTQKSADKLTSKKCSVDDGSFSVFAAQSAIPYICLEADAKNGGLRQSQMFDSVYELLKRLGANSIETDRLAIDLGETIRK
jgi:hypothetical protein